MQTTEALDALRSLTDLPAGRRGYLCALAANARTDADRAQIVLEARAEERRVRQNLEADLMAELQARARWAQDQPAKPSEAPQKPSRRGERIERDDSATPAHRPVTVRYVEPTKTATKAQARERRPMNGPVRHHGSEKVEKTPPAPKADPITHATSSAYRSGCRCDDCREWKAKSRRGIGRTRRANGEPAPHGSTTNYARGCRCQLCRDAVNAHARKKRAEKKRGAN